MTYFVSKINELEVYILSCFSINGARASSPCLKAGASTRAFLVKTMYALALYGQILYSFYYTIYKGNNISERGFR